MDGMIQYSRSVAVSQFLFHAATDSISSFCLCFSPLFLVSIPIELEAYKNPEIF